MVIEYERCAHTGEPKARLSFGEVAMNLFLDATSDWQEEIQEAEETFRQERLERVHLLTTGCYQRRRHQGAP